MRSCATDVNGCCVRRIAVSAARGLDWMLLLLPGPGSQLRHHSGSIRTFETRLREFEVRNDSDQTHRDGSDQGVPAPDFSPTAANVPVYTDLLNVCRHRH